MGVPGLGEPGKEGARGADGGAARGAQPGAARAAEGGRVRREPRARTLGARSEHPKGSGFSGRSGAQARRGEEAAPAPSAARSTPPGQHPSRALGGQESAKPGEAAGPAATLSATGRRGVALCPEKLSTHPPTESGGATFPTPKQELPSLEAVGVENVMRCPTTREMTQIS